MSIHTVVEAEESIPRRTTAPEPVKTTTGNSTVRSPAEPDLVFSAFQFVVFCTIFFLLAKNGVRWWESTIDPLFPHSLRYVSDIFQLGISALAFFSALSLFFQATDLWRLILKLRRS